MSYARPDQYKSINSAVRWIAECAADEVDLSDLIDEDEVFNSSWVINEIEQGDWVSEFVEGECIYDDTCKEIVNTLSDSWNGASSLFENPKTVQEAAYGTLYDFIYEHITAIVNIVGKRAKKYREIHYYDYLEDIDY